MRSFQLLLALALRTLASDDRRASGQEMLEDAVRLVSAERQRRGRLAAGALSGRIIGDVLRAGTRARLGRLRSRASSLAREARDAVRRLRRGGGVTVTTVAITALAIGASIAVSGVVAAILFDDHGVADAERVVSLQRTRGPNPTSLFFEYPDYERFQRSGVFDRAAAAAFTSLPCSCRDAGRPVLAGVVTAEFFDVFGVTPHRGRFPGASERGSVAVSHALAVDALGGADDAIGAHLRIRDRIFTVVGVVPPAFLGPFAGIEPSVWVSMNDQPSVLLAPKFLRATWPDLRTARGYAWAHIWGHLGADVSPAVARERLAPADDGLELVPIAAARVPPQLRDITRRVVNGVALATGLLVVLCAAALMQVSLLRAERAMPQLALKLTLGAPLTAVLAAPLLDSALIVAAAGVLGLALAPLLFQAVLLTLPPTTVPIAVTLSVLTWRTGLVAVGLVLVLALIPPVVACVRLFRRRRQAARMMDGGLRVAVAGVRRAGAVAVLIQALAAATLVAIVSLVVAGLASYRRTELGFAPQGLLVVEFDLDHLNLSDAQGVAMANRIREAIRETPGVAASTFAWRSPVNVLGRSSVLSLDPRPRRAVQIGPNYVDANYFEVLGVPIRSGAVRLGPETGPQVINERYARLIGEQQRSGTAERIEVAGIVADVRYGSLIGDAEPTYYLPLENHYEPRLKALVRTAWPFDAISAALRQRLSSVAPDLQNSVIRPMSANLAVAEWLPRALSRVVGLFAAVALGVALAGTFAIVAFVGQCRRRELAIHAALGASRGRLRRLSLGGIGWPIGLGSAIGAALGWQSLPWVRAVLGIAGEGAAVIVIIATIVVALLGLAAASTAGAVGRGLALSALLKAD
jgi:putative ABC transport system permease protein